jgi:hypothetical protein
LVTKLQPFEGVQATEVHMLRTLLKETEVGVDDTNGYMGGCSTPPRPHWCASSFKGIRHFIFKNFGGGHPPFHMHTHAWCAFSFKSTAHRAAALKVGIVFQNSAVGADVNTVAVRCVSHRRNKALNVPSIFVFFYIIIPP